MVKLNNGQSIIELLISLALAVTVMLTAFSVLQFLIRLTSYGPVAQTATFLARQAAYSVTSAADGSWNGIIAQAIPGTRYHIATSTAGFILVLGSATTTVNSIAYTTYFMVEPVARDATTDMPVVSGGVDDPATKKIITTISWTYQGKPSVDSIEKYIVRAKNEVIWQTDWSGGATYPGSDPIIVFSASPTQWYQDESNTLDYISIPGSIKILGF